MEPKFVSRPAFIVAGLLRRGTPDSLKIAELWRQFFQRMGELPDTGGAQAVAAAYDSHG